MLTKEMELLVTENMGLAWRVVKEFISTGIEYDDLRSLAYLGLVKAAKSFDPEKGYKFSSFANRCMRNEILLYLRQRRKQVPCISYDAIMEEGETPYLDFLGKEDPELKQIDNIGWYDALTRNLSDREKKVVDLVIMHKKSQTAICKEMGISQSYISRIRKTVTQKMKAAL